MTGALAQDPPVQAGKSPVAQTAVSICTQWQQIQRLRQQSPAMARTLPPFESLRPFCISVQQQTSLSISPVQRQRLIASACRDWRQLASIRRPNPAPAFPELAQTCAEPTAPEMLKYSCTSASGKATTTGCCCLGAFDCAIADRAGTCSTRCQGAKEFCESVQKGVFRVLPN